MTQARDIELDIEEGCSELRIQTDAGKFRNIFGQLLSSVGRFTASGPIRVDIRTGQDGLEIAVSDTGPGIPSEYWQSVFYPFQQGMTSPIRRYPGTGLGLCMVRRLTDLLNGDVALRGNENGGNTFQLTLPGLASSDDIVKPRPDPDRIAVDVLIVDENPYVVETLSDILEKEAGCRIRRAYNSMEAILRLTEKKPDLLLIDVFASQINGEYVLQYGLGCWGDEACKVVALHDENTADDDRRALEERAAMLLCKDDLEPESILRRLAPYLTENT